MLELSGYRLSEQTLLVGYRRPMLDTHLATAAAVADGLQGRHR
jgi:hypothetical protein